MFAKELNWHDRLRFERNDILWINYKQSRMTLTCGANVCLRHALVVIVVVVPDYFSGDHSKWGRLTEGLPEKNLCGLLVEFITGSIPFLSPKRQLQSTRRDGTRHNWLRRYRVEFFSVVVQETTTTGTINFRGRGRLVIYLNSDRVKTACPAAAQRGTCFPANLCGGSSRTNTRVDDGIGGDTRRRPKSSRTGGAQRNATQNERGTRQRQLARRSRFISSRAREKHT